MKTIKEILNEMLDLAHELSAQMTEQDEFVMVSELQKNIEKAKEVFERTKDIKDVDSHN